MNQDEQLLEVRLQEKGLTAPRLTLDKISEVIVGEEYYVFPGTALIVCCLKLRNGFTVTGESTAVYLDKFDESIGKQIAYDNARDKIWALEGYLLREQLNIAKHGIEKAKVQVVPDVGAGGMVFVE
jgi:Phage protein (N4 Gp49/phage Sf6 gene 66) family